ncbi:unnamed protein product [Phaedon cochleariae]|uniref:Uncharacterized protein n=1 Tax=Phaedon cochleariae TaxID=80249 RepID=A0A9P0DMI9_PHACE|nr:unnamed protein product [Phaedon cochleariae]
MMTDILLLADVFEQFRNSCLKTYDLDPAHYYTLPGFTWDAMMKFTNQELELITDPDMFLFVEQRVRGGLSQERVDEHADADSDDGRDEGYGESTEEGVQRINFLSTYSNLADLRSKWEDMEFCTTISKVTLVTSEGLKHLCVPCFSLYMRRPGVAGEYQHTSSHSMTRFDEIPWYFECAACSMDSHQIHLADVCPTCCSVPEKVHVFEPLV